MPVQKYMLPLLLLWCTFVKANEFKTEIFATGLSRPVFLIQPPRDNTRLFAIEQHTGRIRILNAQNGQLNTEHFLTIGGMSTENEEGLLGLAFHPSYNKFGDPNNRYFYIYASFGSPRRSEIRRYRVSTSNPDLAETASTLMLSFTQPQSNHNGGWIGFGNDGYLYIASGDGGGSNDSGTGHTASIGNSQDLNNLLGKILRIDVDGDDFPSDSTKNYAIPPSNPFVGKSGLDEIWAYGLRNPWRCSFDRVTHDFYIADVGQGAREEINFQPANSSGGENYGWRLREGFIATPTSGIGGAKPDGAIDPIHDYQHIAGANGGYSVTGGYVYRGPITALHGHYFFADYVSNQIWSLRYIDGTVSAFQNRTAALKPTDATISSISSFGEDNAGNLYILSLSGTVYKVTPNITTIQPLFTSSPITSAAVGNLYNYAANASGSPAPHYTLLTAPTGMTIDAATGLLSWLPQSSGSFNVTIAATNSAGSTNQSYTIVVAALRPPEFATGPIAGLTGGIEYSYYAGSFDRLPQFEGLEALKSGNLPSIELSPRTHANGSALRFSGFVEVAQDGQYTFYLESAGSCKLWIGHATVVDNDGQHMLQEVAGSIGLKAGKHAFTLGFSAPNDSDGLKVSYQGPQISKMVLPDARLFRFLAAYGLDTRPVIGPFLNAKVPSSENGSIPVLLSQTGVFEQTATLIPTAGLIPYTVLSPLWSDGAHKLRWLALPVGTTIEYKPNGEWNFPAGSVFVKHFEIGSSRRRLETRLLAVKTDGSVYGITYRWNESQTDAVLLNDAFEETLNVDGKTQLWTYPSRSQCLQCHNANSKFILGLKTRQLNGSFLYRSTGKSDNQLRTMNRLGCFVPALSEAAISGLDRLVEVSDTTATLSHRVRSYLDVNCAVCHIPGGAPSNFNAHFDTPLEQQQIVNGTVNNNLGIDQAKLVKPGAPERSILLHRTASTLAAIRMPPLARNVPDAAAIAALTAWINSLNAPDSVAPTIQARELGLKFAVTLKDTTITEVSVFSPGHTPVNAVKQDGLWQATVSMPVNGNALTIDARSADGSSITQFLYLP